MSSLMAMFFEVIFVCVCGYAYLRPPPVQGSASRARSRTFTGLREQEEATGLSQRLLALLKELIESGKVRPVIDRRYTLDRTAEERSGWLMHFKVFPGFEDMVGDGRFTRLPKDMDFFGAEIGRTSHRAKEQ